MADGRWARSCLIETLRTCLIVLADLTKVLPRLLQVHGTGTPLGHNVQAESWPLGRSSQMSLEGEVCGVRLFHVGVGREGLSQRLPRSTA